MSQRKPEPDRYDPTQPPYEAYKVDFELFRILFGGLSPWGKCSQAESLAARLFRVSRSKFLQPGRRLLLDFDCFLINGTIK